MKKISALRLFKPNRGKFYFCIVYDPANWTGRSMRAKGMLNSERLYIRDATPEEIEEISQLKREIAFFYETWEHLVEDEAKYGIDANKLKEENSEPV